MSITPKHWAEFQHYKDRAPAWIKLHRKLLDDFAFNCLPLASRALAPMLWLLASEYEGGKITASTQEMAFRLRVTEDDLVAALNPLIESGFFVSDSTVLAPRKQVACLEKEREKQEKRREREDTGAVADATRPNAGKLFDEEFWKAYPRREGANPKSPARKAFQTAVKSGHDPTAIIDGARRYTLSLQASNQIGTRYVAQAVTWLHQARWEDYPPDSVVDPTGPPKPPDPTMPSDDELRRKYEAANGGKSLSGGGADHQEQLRPAGDLVCPNSPEAASDNRARKPGMASLGSVLPRVPGVRAVDYGINPPGRADHDDGPDAVAGMVRQ